MKNVTDIWYQRNEWKISSEVGMYFSIQYRKMSRNICNPDVPKLTSFKVNTSFQCSNYSLRTHRKSGLCPITIVFPSFSWDLWRPLMCSSNQSWLILNVLADCFSPHLGHHFWGRWSQLSLHTLVRAPLFIPQSTAKRELGLPTSFYWSLGGIGSTTWRGTLDEYLGRPSILICPELKEFLGNFSLKTVSVLGKPGQVVHPTDVSSWTHRPDLPHLGLHLGYWSISTWLSCFFPSLSPPRMLFP